MYNKYYTLITGASEGFGKALAIECAKRKMNLILVALPGPELHSLADFIERNFRVDAVTIEKDLCKDGSCTQLFDEVKAMKLQVNMLINNAGIGSSVLFTDGSITLYEKQIKLNVLAITLITRLFIETLERNSPSYILNVGSMSSFFYLLKKQVYGATKSYVYYFSKSLRRELEKDDIHVSVLCPGSMNTNVALTLINKTGTFFSRLPTMNPEEVAPIAIDSLLRGKEVIIPGRINKFYMFMDKLLPKRLKKSITNHNMRKVGFDAALGLYLPENYVPIPGSLALAQKAPI